MRSGPLIGGRKVAAVAIVFALFLFPACTVRQTVVEQKDLHRTYLHAISDAAIAEPSEISRNLTAITATNAKLIWKNVAGKSSVRVVTWTNYAGYDDKIGQAVKIPVYLRVTVAPELQDFCRASNLEVQALALRLEQLLGLLPNCGKTRFVELWVDPKDLFRPSPDPEISDAEAELDFPVSDRFIKVSGAHVTWFEELMVGRINSLKKINPIHA